MTTRGAPESGAPAPLDVVTAALVRVAAALAEGELGVLRDRLAAARSAGVPDLWVEELLLQSLLVVGYPLTLVAFAAWRELAGPLPVAGNGEGGGEELAHEEWTSWAKRGAVVCAEVYGRASLGAIFGFIFTAMNVGSGVGAWLSGLDYDLTGNYHAALLLNGFMGFAAAATILAARARPLRPQATEPGLAAAASERQPVLSGMGDD